MDGRGRRSDRISGRRSRSSSIAGESLNNPGPNVNAYEEDLRRFVTSNNESAV